jgi:hypothetical protein
MGGSDSYVSAAPEYFIWNKSGAGQVLDLFSKI